MKRDTRLRFSCAVSMLMPGLLFAIGGGALSALISGIGLTQPLSTGQGIALIASMVLSLIGGMLAGLWVWARAATSRGVTREEMRSLFVTPEPHLRFVNWLLKRVVGLVST